VDAALRKSLQFYLCRELQRKLAQISLPDCTASLLLSGFFFLLARFFVFFFDGFIFIWSAERYRCPFFGQVHHGPMEALTLKLRPRYLLIVFAFRRRFNDYSDFPHVFVLSRIPQGRVGVVSFWLLLFF